MAKRKEIAYNSPSEWLKTNRKSLGIFAGEWIAFTNTGVIIHNKNGRIVAQKARKTELDYSLKYVHPLEVPRFPLVKISMIRITKPF